MKTCFKCSRTLELSQFYRHKAMADGHLGKCKECTKNDANTHRAANLERIRAYDRKRGKLARRIAERTVNMRAYRLRFPERYAANRAVDAAVKSGALVRLPCAMCEEKRTQGHHPDYSKPLDVIWLCAVHHTAIHLAHPD